MKSTRFLFETEKLFVLHIICGYAETVNVCLPFSSDSAVRPQGGRIMLWKMQLFSLLKNNQLHTKYGSILSSFYILLYENLIEFNLAAFKLQIHWHRDLSAYLDILGYRDISLNASFL